MTNSQYIEKMITSVERILVDTSTLMTRGFQQFIGNNKELLLSGNHKITVPKAVYTELARHMDSSNGNKSSLALAAIELMALNKDIFQVESVPLTDEEIAHAFADAQLLSELTLHRSDCNQLLITNDRKLSCDAYDLNLQQSCKGRKVLVCYINWCGEMQCCECVRTSTERTAEKPLHYTDEIIEEQNCPNLTPNDTHEHETKDNWKFDWVSGLISISGLGALYGIYKGGKMLLKKVA